MHPHSCAGLDFDAAAGWPGHRPGVRASQRHEAVILDCINEAAKSFYRRYDFRELPGHPYRLFLSARQLQAVMEGP